MSTGTRSGSAHDVGLLLIRVIVGVVFAFHGAQKLFGAFDGPGLEGAAGFMESLGLPLPTVSAALAGGAEFFGGLAFITGVAHRLFAIPLTFTMLVAAFVAHGDAFALSAGGMEYSLTLGVVAAGLGLTGPGRFALMSGRTAATA